MSKLVFVKKSVSTFVDGARVRIVEGDVWAADDPVVKARPELFADEPEKVHRSIETAARPRGVEQATAAPGERRAVKRTAKKG